MSNIRTQVTWLAAAADQMFNAVFAFVIVVFILPHVVASSSAQQTTFRDSSGRTTGTAATTGNTTTFRDSSGRTVGTGTIDSSGITTFRDSNGRTTGTASGRRR
jgi:uncharacterized membrane protein YoaK (UPF0700 family)